MTTSSPGPPGRWRPGNDDTSTVREAHDLVTIAERLYKILGRSLTGQTHARTQTQITGSGRHLLDDDHVIGGAKHQVATLDGRRRTQSIQLLGGQRESEALRAGAWPKATHEQADEPAVFIDEGPA